MHDFLTGLLGLVLIVGLFGGVVAVFAALGAGPRVRSGSKRR